MITDFYCSSGETTSQYNSPLIINHLSPYLVNKKQEKGNANIEIRFIETRIINGRKPTVFQSDLDASRQYKRKQKQPCQKIQITHAFPH